MEYYILIVFEDESRFEGKISSKHDVNNIPKDKAYQFIKIFYSNNLEYSHIINGNDFVYFNYHKPPLKEGFLEIGQWDENDGKEVKLSKEIIQLKGIDKEEIKTDKRTLNRLTKTFTGKLIDDQTFETIRKSAEKWKPEVK